MFPVQRRLRVLTALRHIRAGPQSDAAARDIYLARQPSCNSWLCQIQPQVENLLTRRRPLPIAPSLYRKRDLRVRKEGRSYFGHSCEIVRALRTSTVLTISLEHLRCAQKGPQYSAGEKPARIRHLRSESRLESHFSKSPRQTAT